MDPVNTRESIALNRKEDIRSYFADFQECAKSFKLYNFTLRVSPESVAIRNPQSGYPPWQFDFFEDLYKQMSEKERRKYYPRLKHLYETMLLKCRDFPEIRFRIPFFRRTFTLLLRLAESFGPETVSSLITKCKKTLGVKVCYFLKIVPVKDWSVVLRCFPTHWSVAKCHRSVALMPNLLYRGKSVPLIQHGFPYSFDQDYFGWRVAFFLREASRPQIKGKLLKNEIRQSIRDSGSLRLQMAVELLSAMFDETHAYDLNILDLLWRAVPFPYISSTEMFTLLSPFFERTDLLQELCEEYKERNTMFEVPEVTQPRSLKHLSRVRVRKCMCDANTIGEEAIDGLDLPVILKDYLRLSFHEVYFDVVS